MKNQTGYYKTWKDSINNIINNITIESFAFKDNNKNIHLNCKCICGNTFIRAFSALNKKTSNNSCGCLNSSIYSEAGKTNRKFYVNNGKLFDNNETSYIGGLLGSDGHYNKTKNSIELTLQDQDYKILEEISNYVEYSGKISKNKNRNITRLVISDPSFCIFFKNRGIIPNKSKIYKVPDIYKNNSNYWRGMIDGDGCIHITKDNRLLLSLCGTYDVVYNFKLFCNSIVETKNKIIEHKNKDLFSFNISGEKAIKILTIIYENKNNLFLERKYNKYKRFL